MPEDPEPPDAAAERLSQQAQRDKEHRGGHGIGQDVRRRNGQHDAHDRGDHPGPLPGRLRTAQPRQHPAGGHERVPGQTHREHPPARLTCDVNAQDHDQERVDLHVEARPERRGGAGTPSDPAVDPVEHQRHRRERHEYRRRRLAPERVHRERRDPTGEDCASQGHAVRRPQSDLAVTRQRASKQGGKAGSAGDTGQPAGRVEAGGRREDTEEREQADEAGERAGRDPAAYLTLKPTHRASVSQGVRTVIR